MRNPDNRVSSRGRSVDRVETEWQFDAADLDPVEQWLTERPEAASLRVSPARTDTLVDAYADTEDWRLYRAGFALRVRRSAAGFEATLKSLDRAEGSIRRRREIEGPSPGAEPESARQASGDVGRIVRVVAGRRRLVRLFEARTRREELGLSLAGEAIGSVALDETLLVGRPGAEPEVLRRVEVEVHADRVEQVRPFVEEMRVACALAAAGASKNETGLAACGLRPGFEPRLGPSAVNDAQPLGEVAYAVLRQHFAAFLEREPGTRLGEDAEDLHKMRVATRRLRAAMRLFRDVLPERAVPLRQELSWIADALGRVRDLDVHLEDAARWIEEAQVADREALVPVVELLERQRAGAREELVEVLDSERYERFVAGYTGMVREGPAAGLAADVPVLAVAPELIMPHYRRVRKAGDRLEPGSPPSEYHALRIRCKRLRYAVEFLSDVYGKPAQSLARRVVDLQDLLGLHQDAQVIADWLRELGARHGGELPPRTTFLMGEMVQRCAQRASDLRARFPGTFAGIRKPWRRLRRVMERRRVLPWRRPGASG